MNKGKIKAVLFLITFLLVMAVAVNLLLDMERDRREVVHLPVDSPAPTAAPATPAPVQTAAPFQMPVSTPAQTQTRTNLPVITKNPTDEIVEAGGSCWFVAKYDNARWAVWHFVSPSGTDYTYDQINTVFPGLEVTKGYASTTQLKNIPVAI